MKDKKIFIILIGLCLCTNVFSASFKSGSKVYISVKSAEIKADKSFFSKTCGNADYGNQFTVIESNEKMTKITANDGSELSGWVSNGSLTSKKIASTGNSKVNASSDELALAGKGFSAEAEKAFKTENAQLNYNAVDKMEKISVSNSELSNFITEGHLNGGEQ